MPKGSAGELAPAAWTVPLRMDWPAIGVVPLMPRATMMTCVWAVASLGVPGTGPDSAALRCEALIGLEFGGGSGRFGGVVEGGNDGGGGGIREEMAAIVDDGHRERDALRSVGCEVGGQARHLG